VSHSPVRLIVFLLVSLLPALAGAPEHFPHNAPASSSSNRTPRQPQDISPTSVPVFVGDFELFAVGAAAPPRRSSSPPQIKKPAVTSETKNAPPPLLEETDPPAEQARQLMDLFSDTLVESLQKAGYKAVRRAAASGGASGTGKGVALRGVFAEPDDLNRIRRAILGSRAPGAKFLLYVGSFNLSRPDQPLYQLAPVQSADSRYGPVITPNNYIPMVKYEVPKNPTGEDVRKVCDDMVRNLTALLSANAAAFAQ
jgi:hypothetical protein